MKKIPFSDHVSLYQSATINANFFGVVWVFNIPLSTIGFLDSMASNLFLNGKITLEIDGERVFNDFERVLGPIENPSKVDPPYVVRRQIRVLAKNDDSEDHIYEAFLDGFLVHAKSTLGE